MGFRGLGNRVAGRWGRKDSSSFEGILSLLINLS